MSLGLIRTIAFNVWFWAWGALLAILILPVLLLPRPALMAIARFWMGSVQVALRVMVGIEHEVRGREQIPDGPAIFAFKHQSAFETLLQHGLFRDPAVALKREILAIPLFGWYCRKLGMIGIDRKAGAKAMRRLMREAKAALARGAEIVIFPEGTRVAPGERRPYHPGIAALYLHLGAPVVPIALNSGVFWGRNRFIKRPGRIALEFLEPIAPGLDRKAFMAELEARLEPATDRLVAEAQAQLASADPSRAPAAHPG